MIYNQDPRQTGQNSAFLNVNAAVKVYWSGSPAIAKIFGNNEPAKIIIQADSDVVDSLANIECLKNGSIRFFNNKFAMDVVREKSGATSSVEAFRNGCFL